MITRCPECATAFRVTAEQLAARQGRVRCGHCAAIFDAIAGLESDREDGASELPVESGAGREAAAPEPTQKEESLAPPSRQAPRTAQDVALDSEALDSFLAPVRPPRRFSPWWTAAAALLFVGSRPSRRMEWPWMPR